MKNVKFIAVLALLLVLPAVLFAAGDSEKGSASGAAQTVEIWGWRAQDAPVWEQVQEALQAKGANVVIDYRPFAPTEYDSKLLVSLQGEAGPDIMYTRRLPGERTQALIDSGYIVPLDNEIDFSTFTQATLNFIQDGGSTWGIPFANQIVGVFYNTDLYEKYGLKEPKSWDELVKNAQVLKKNGVTPFFVPGKEAWTLAMQHAMVGVSLPGQDFIKKLIDGKAKFNDPQIVDLNTRLDSLKQYYQKDFMANSTAEQDASFALGEAAMVFYGIWGTSNWKELNPDFNFGYFPVPPASASEEPYAYVYMDGSYALNNSSDVKEAALQVLAFAATPDYGTIFSNTTGEMTAVANVDMPADRPVLVEAYKTSTSIAAEYLYWVGSPFQKGKPTPYSILREGMQSMYIGETTPKALADKLNEGVSSWYKPEK